MNRLPIYAAPELGAYGYHEKAWFKPDVRLQGFLTALAARDFGDVLEFRHAPPATDEEILLFHTAAHLHHVRTRCATNEGALDEGPTFARAHIERAATHVVGAVMDATRGILRGDFETAFVPIAGFHHAHADQARMYCLYNDPAIALSFVLTQLAGTVAYIDIDVHQGDGVYAAFASEPRVRIVDLHEDPSTLFPHTPAAPGEGAFPGRRTETGQGAGLGCTLNIPLAPYTTDEDFLAHWTEAEAFIRQSRPQFIVFASGVDCLEGDPLSNQCVTVAAIHEVTRRVRALARETAQGRLLVLGGGGYDLDNVAQGWTTVVDALLSPEV